MILIVDISDLPLVKDFQASLSKSESKFCGDYSGCLGEWWASGEAKGHAGTADVIISRGFSKLVAGIRAWKSQSVRPIVAVSSGGFGGVILDVLRAGALDYLDVSLNASSQLQSIMQKLNALYCQPSSTLPQGLTVAQTRVANLLLSNDTEREISERLGVSYFTIHNHVKEIYRKCNVHSRVQFVNSLRFSTTNANRCLGDVVGTMATQQS